MRILLTFFLTVTVHISLANAGTNKCGQPSDEQNQKIEKGYAFALTCEESQEIQRLLLKKDLLKESSETTRLYIDSYDNSDDFFNSGPKRIIISDDDLNEVTVAYDDKDILTNQILDKVFKLYKETKNSAFGLELVTNNDGFVFIEAALGGAAN